MSTQLDQEIEISNVLGKPYKVILFNDETHNIHEVTVQIIKAIHCTAEHAINIMLEAHTTGQAVVFTGSKERCELVAEILGEIQLTTDIIPA
jgi:ATP-dependent Clp protease adaptor protein ClpS